MRCPSCGRDTRTLDARAILRGEQRGRVVTESQLLIDCAPPPEGCGTRRLILRTVTVEDQGETRRRSIAAEKSQRTET